MEQLLRSPLMQGLSGQFDKIRKVITPPPKGQLTHKPETETESEEMSDMSGMKKIIPDPSTPMAEQYSAIQDAVRKAYEAGHLEGRRTREASLAGSTASSRTIASQQRSQISQKIINDPRNYEQYSSRDPDSSMIGPTVVTDNQSKRVVNKPINLSFPQGHKPSSRTASERNLNADKLKFGPRRNSNVTLAPSKLDHLVTPQHVSAQQTETKRIKASRRTRMETLMTSKPRNLKGESNGRKDWIWTRTNRNLIHRSEAIQKIIKISSIKKLKTNVEKVNVNSKCLNYRSIRT